MESLEEFFESSLSITQLEADKMFLENEQQAVVAKLRKVKELLNNKKPSLMEIQNKKRKIEALDDAELEKFVATVKALGPVPLDEKSTDDEEEEKKLGPDGSVKKIIKPRKCYSKDIKEKALKLILVFGLQKVVTESNIHETNLRRWMKNGTTPSNGKRGRKVKHPNLEEELLKFIDEKRKAHKATTSRVVTRKAQTIAKQLKITDLNFSWGWFVKFMKRNQLSLRAPTTKLTKCYKTLSTDAEVFATNFRKYLENRKFFIFFLNNSYLALYHPDFILNLDETMIMKDPEIKRIVTNTGEKKVPLKTSGKEKKGYTIAPLVSFSGKLLTTLLVWPSKGVKSFKINSPSNLFIAYRPDGSWIDSKVIEEYTRQVIRPYFRDVKPKDKKGLLLLDNHQCHKLIRPMLSNYGVDVVFFPPNCTSLLQPLDISTNISIKTIYRNLWTDWHIDPQGNKKMIVIEHKKNPDEISNETFLTWLSKTLKEVQKDTIINGWNPLVKGIKEDQASNLSNIADVDEIEGDDIALIEELIHDQEEEHGFTEEMLDYEVVQDDDIKIKIEF